MRSKRLKSTLTFLHIFVLSMKYIATGYFLSKVIIKPTSAQGYKLKESSSSSQRSTAAALVRIAAASCEDYTKRAFPRSPAAARRVEYRVTSEAEGSHFVPSRPSRRTEPSN
uniref:Secreted protein n=1 Tax=Steinernema glaseri TaxID=37863 RepID=A0A1I7Y9P6_9BILA